ncbi:unnamed protein product [Notodromas monacha]|uniref:Uncharacterized protein n=1 Tax=Notodromas monacha TaxID=399045 RepID=A0A7R9GEY2_9CRUS|nr:unnamed protein product [Notodromas monacha]CAG0918742.1 unnamed protein product [Notodromas monacha]
MPGVSSFRSVTTSFKRLVFETQHEGIFWCMLSIVESSGVPREREGEKKSEIPRAASKIRCHEWSGFSSASAMNSASSWLMKEDHGRLLPHYANWLLQGLRDCKMNAELSNKVALFNQVADNHKEKQMINPFSSWDGASHRRKLDKSDASYGKSKKGKDGLQRSRKTIITGVCFLGKQDVEQRKDRAVPTTQIRSCSSKTH